MRPAASKRNRGDRVRRAGGRDTGTFRVAIVTAATVVAASAILIGAFALLRDPGGPPQPFTATTTAGNTVVVPDPGRPTVLVFYRGFF